MLLSSKLGTIIIKSTQHPRLLILLPALGLPHISETRKCELSPVFLQRGAVRRKAIMYVPDDWFNVTGCFSVCMPFQGKKHHEPIPNLLLQVLENNYIWKSGATLFYTVNRLHANMTILLHKDLHWT